MRTTKRLLCRKRQIPVASVVCTMATTDANAFGPVEEVRNLIEKYPNPEGFGKTLLYCDSVIGWSWIAFKNYDFKANPLGFSDSVLPYIEKNYNAIKGIFYADAFGVDFHKTGFSPYISSVSLSIKMRRNLNLYFQGELQLIYSLVHLIIQWITRLKFQELQPVPWQDGLP